MNGAAIAAVAFLAVTFFIAAIIFIVLFIKALTSSVSDDRHYMRTAFIVMGIWLVMLLAYIICNKLAEKRFEDIPLLSVEENTFTVLQEGSSSLGTESNYFLSGDDILNETEQTIYRMGLLTKEGYTFEIEKSGQAYLALVQLRGGNNFAIDVYSVDMSNVQLEKQYPSTDDLQSVIEDISASFGFSGEELAERYERFLK